MALCCIGKQGVGVVVLGTHSPFRAFSDNTTDSKLVANSYRGWSTPERWHQLKPARLPLLPAGALSTANHIDTELNPTDAGISAYRGPNTTEGALAPSSNACRGGRIAKGSVLLRENLDRPSPDVV